MLIVVPTPSIEFIGVAEATGNCIQRRRFKKKTPDLSALRIRFARLRDEAPVLVVEQLEVFFLEANRHNT
jgi:hypothetical protein